MSRARKAIAAAALTAIGAGLGLAAAPHAEAKLPVDGYATCKVFLLDDGSGTPPPAGPAGLPKPIECYY